jgi:hypothetical protein
MLCRHKKPGDLPYPLSHPNTPQGEREFWTIYETIKRQQGIAISEHVDNKDSNVFSPLLLRRFTHCHFFSANPSGVTRTRFKAKNSLPVTPEMDGYYPIIFCFIKELNGT